MNPVRASVLFILLMMRIELGGGQDEDAPWINLSNNPFVNTDYPLDHPKNSRSCRDRGLDNKAAADGDRKKTTGIFHSINEDTLFAELELHRKVHWMEAKELGKPITDPLPLEGRAFCLSGKHYKNSPELFNHVDFENMKELAEYEFDIGSHVYPRDYAKINFYRPLDTNTRGNTSFGRQPIYGRIYKTIPSILRQRLPENLWRYPNLFWIRWKRADETFFHIRRTFVQYLRDGVQQGDPDPKARRLESYFGSVYRRGDKNLLYLYRPSEPVGQADPKCKNPYFAEVTEIDVNGVKLHNWLHITVYVRPENIVKSLKNCATGKMRWILLEVRDSMGLPIGDFDSDFPCGASCRCKSAFCKMVKGAKHNAMPCMFTPTRALTQPGLFMYGVKENEARFTEIHATWHFAQHTSYFATELHISALVVEDSKVYKFYTGRRTTYRNPRTCAGVVQPFTWFCDTKCEAERHLPSVYPYAYDPTTGGPFGGAPQGFYACNKYISNIPHYEGLSKRIFTWAWDYKIVLPDVPGYGNPNPLGTYYYESNTPNVNDCGTGSSHQFDMAHHKWFYQDKNQTIGEIDPLRPFEYYEWSLQHLSKKKRHYGWNAQYTVLKPTLETLGGWDHYQPNKLTDPAQINCHKKINENFYKTDRKQSLKGRLPLKHNFYRYNQAYRLDEKVYTNISFRIKGNLHRIYKPRIAQELAANDSSDYETIYSVLPVNINVTNPNNKHGPPYSLNRVYFGTFGTKLAYEDELSIERNKLRPEQVGYDEQFENTAIAKYFRTLPTVQEISRSERCACPAFGTTQEPEQQTKQLEELQGRSAHATQMLLAWVVLIPIGLFVSRYYKETYNRVFILEEFWWYTTHVMCMSTALVFMIGGIYAIEVKDITREKFETWSPETQAHIIVGGVVICLFAIQLFLSPFRMWIIAHRIANILLHFLFGIMSYILGIVVVLISVTIPQSRMSCSAFYIYVAFLVIQALIYVVMELHMRYVDRILLLYPPRSYLPPPVIRVFHTNAPLSQIRIVILCVYVAFCWIVFFILRYGAIELDVASCYKNLNNDYEDDA